ncbi:glycoside hydrolase [Polaribacter reichenbachii]|uniref:Glycoside hydrolase n=1 Tax=Polaribacter reichenbachii TaxID=996801 RepID=A0A1B8TUP3_9FLAO|nr:glycosyl hydrolase family 28 protein [Polaribacter reichenbachii]APZ45572.1 glycoside hydrolase [Polaribacter reichenbachii]AUC19434.1 glycoside hydrolase [Polaribacter reichenbachii]OBY63411.1 glycoside hydrolase [Polaribacter reichenbachii]
MYKSLVLFIVLLVVASCQKQTIWDVKDYGAKDDNLTVNTKFIQKAIDECHKAGGGTVTINGGVFVSGTILLKSNVTLNITEKTTLLGSINPLDYPIIEPFIDATGQFRGQCFIAAIDAENVAITGRGTIDGQGKMLSPKNVKKTLKKLGLEDVKPDLTGLEADSNNYVNNNIRLSNRPFLVRMVRSKKIKLKYIHLRQPAAWTLHFLQCDNFEVDGIDIYSHANRNNDAIDIDSSTNGVIKNCTIDSGDDAICFKSTSPEATANIEVYDCKISSHWGAIKFGTESMGDMKNITIRDCLVYNTKGGGIKIISADGANVDNILIENIQMENVEMPIFIRLCERRLVYRNANRKSTGSINNVTIRNITAQVSDLEKLRMKPTTGLYFSGTPNHSLGSINLENIKIDVPGGGTKEDRKITVPENETEYPEFTKLGATPAYGLFARHIKNLVTKNVVFTTRSNDKREETILINVDKFN